MTDFIVDDSSINNNTNNKNNNSNSNNNRNNNNNIDNVLHHISPVFKSVLQIRPSSTKDVLLPITTALPDISPDASLSNFLLFYISILMCLPATASSRLVFRLNKLIKKLQLLLQLKFFC